MWAPKLRSLEQLRQCLSWRWNPGLCGLQGHPWNQYHAHLTLICLVWSPAVGNQWQQVAPHHLTNKVRIADSPHPYSYWDIHYSKDNLSVLFLLSLHCNYL